MAGMELFFNLVWLFAAFALVFFWGTMRPAKPTPKRNSIIALTLLIVILFPVISVSDDLWSIQNPAEADTALRRDHASQAAHSNLVVHVGLPEFPTSGLEGGWASSVILPHINPVILGTQFFFRIQNRPPPAC